MRIACPALAALLLVPSLTACQNTAANTTCADFTQQSSADQRRTVKQAAPVIARDQAEKEKINKSTDEELDALIGKIVEVCSHPGVEGRTLGDLKDMPRG